MAEITLEFLGKQMTRTLGEIGSMRDDMTVMMEILRRLDNSIASLGAQLTEMHAYNRRIEARVTKLEEKA